MLATVLAGFWSLMSGTVVVTAFTRVLAAFRLTPRRANLRS